MIKFDALRIAREKIGMSQQELAMASGISQDNISRYETGIHCPTLRSMKRLADAMDLELYIEFREKHERNS